MTASRSGGKCIKQLVSKWKPSNCSFKIFYHELDTSVLVDENQLLCGGKRKAEEDLVEEQAKRLKIEQKLKNVSEASEKSARITRNQRRHGGEVFGEAHSPSRAF